MVSYMGVAVTSAAKKILEEALSLSQQEREELVNESALVTPSIF